MIKIFHTEQIRQADAYTIKHAPVSSIHLMERAAKAFTEQLLQDYPDKCIPKCIVCGNGNNGGDGLAIARMLLSRGIKQTSTFYLQKDTRTIFPKTCNGFP